MRSTLASLYAQWKIVGQPQVHDAQGLAAED